MAKFAQSLAEGQPVNSEKYIMKSSAKGLVSDKKTVKVIRNAHSLAEQRAIGDRWADHKGPRMTVAETLAYAAKIQEQQESAE